MVDKKGESAKNKKPPGNPGGWKEERTQSNAQVH
jgi:hypothetical protein